MVYNGDGEYNHLTFFLLVNVDHVDHRLGDIFWGFNGI